VRALARLRHHLTRRSLGRGGSRLTAASLLAGLGLAAASPDAGAAGVRQRGTAKARHPHSQTHAKPRIQPRARQAEAHQAPSQTENLVVHGQKRFQAAPVPNQAIHDPAEAMRDPATGTAIGQFGGAYNAANPVPPINPGLRGSDQDPIVTGVQR